MKNKIKQENRFLLIESVKTFYIHRWRKCYCRQNWYFIAIVGSFSNILLLWTRIYNNVNSYLQQCHLWNVVLTFIILVFNIGGISFCQRYFPFFSTTGRLYDLLRFYYRLEMYTFFMQIIKLINHFFFLFILTIVSLFCV